MTVEFWWKKPQKQWFRSNLYSLCKWLHICCISLLPSHWLALSSRHHRTTWPTWPAWSNDQMVTWPGDKVNTWSVGHLSRWSGGPQILPASMYHRNILSQPFWISTSTDLESDSNFTFGPGSDLMVPNHQASIAVVDLKGLNWIGFHFLSILNFNFGPVGCWKLSCPSPSGSLSTECSLSRPSGLSLSSEPGRVGNVITIVVVIIITVIVLAITIMLVGTCSALLFWFSPVATAASLWRQCETKIMLSHQWIVFAKTWYLGNWWLVED